MWGYSSQSAGANPWEEGERSFGNSPSPKSNFFQESGGSYLVNPQMANRNRMSRIGYQDFNPMRQRALNDVASSASSNYAGLISNLSRSGGITQADRMNAAREKARQQGLGSVQVGSRLSEIESGSRFDVDRANADMANNVYLSNLDTMNRANELNAATNLRRLESFENRMHDEKLLDRQLEAAGVLADQLDREGKKKTWVERLERRPAQIAGSLAGGGAGSVVGKYADDNKGRLPDWMRW